jgi:hypothetical protein
LLRRYSEHPLGRHFDLRKNSNSHSVTSRQGHLAVDRRANLLRVVPLPTSAISSDCIPKSIAASGAGRVVGVVGGGGGASIYY